MNLQAADMDCASALRILKAEEQEASAVEYIFNSIEPLFWAYQGCGALPPSKFCKTQQH